MPAVNRKLLIVYHLADSVLKIIGLCHILGDCFDDKAVFVV